jgi:ferredoxin
MMRIEFDRETCVGMFNCVKEWRPFIEDRDAGKATLVDSGEAEPEQYVLEVPEGEEFNAKMATRVCPVDAITVYDDDGKQLIPLELSHSRMCISQRSSPSSIHCS